MEFLTQEAADVPRLVQKGLSEIWIYPPRDALLPPIEKAYPFLKPLYFSWELEAYLGPFMQGAREIHWLAPLTACFYLVFLFVGPRIMKNREAFDLRFPLRYWNLALSIFSFFGTLRTLPQAFYLIQTFGFMQSLCVSPAWSLTASTAGLWSVAFICSKFLELIDTVFIVLRKRQVTFLHWYHHLTVLIFCWYALLSEQPAGIYFLAVNYAVHTVMYFYYYLATSAEDSKSTPKWGVYITAFQIIQMIMGVVIAILGLWLSYTYPFLDTTTREQGLNPFSVPCCSVNRPNLALLLIIYSTYCYLFAQFFWRRYVKSSAKAAPLDTKKTL